MDSNASFAGEVERNVSRDNDFFLRDSFLRTPQLVVGQSAVSSRRKRGSTAPVLLLTLEQLHSELAHATLVPLQIVRASLSGGAV